MRKQSKDVIQEFESYPCSFIKRRSDTFAFTGLQQAGPPIGHLIAKLHFEVANFKIHEIISFRRE